VNKCTIPECPTKISETKILCREHWDRLPHYLKTRIIFSTGKQQDRFLREALEFIYDEDLAMSELDLLW
jgi:hypothetical protein